MNYLIGLFNVTALSLLIVFISLTSPIWLVYDLFSGRGSMLALVLTFHMNNLIFHANGNEHIEEKPESKDDTAVM